VWADLLTYAGLIFAGVKGAITVASTVTAAMAWISKQWIPPKSKWRKRLGAIELPLVAVGVVALFFAGFEAWRAEHQQVVHLTTGGRHLTDTQSREIAGRLRKLGNHFTMIWRRSGPEIADYAKDIVAVFVAAGWEPPEVQLGTGNLMPADGSLLIVAQPPLATTLETIFFNAGVSADHMDIPSPTYGDTVEIRIGSKPRD